MWDLWWTKWHWDRFFSEYNSIGATLKWKSRKKLIIFLTGLHNKPSRLRCLRSICCGALHTHKTSEISLNERKIHELHYKTTNI
jgi:hypothetical protein